MSSFQPEQNFSKKKKKEKRVVCERCGQIGHQKTECTVDLNELFEIEKEIENKTKEIADRLVVEYKYSFDQFGPCESSKDERYSWENTSYCVNCGSNNHLWSHCPFPKFHEILERMEENSDEEYVRVFNELKKKH